jgi:hypothetical protein
MYYHYPYTYYTVPTYPVAPVYYRPFVPTFRAGPWVYLP